jgi:hypothetical protein
MVNDKTKFNPDANRDKMAIECFHAQVVKLNTGDGLAKAKGLVIGQTMILVKHSQVISECITPLGVKHKKWTYEAIDVNGKPLGKVFAEWFFPDMVVL